MEVVMDKDISNYSLLESNGVRKIVAKKNMSEIPKLKENFFKACGSENLAKYVWDTCLLPQMGYGFSKLRYWS